VGASTDVLQRVPLFSGLKEKQLKGIAQAMAERTFASGDEITKEGEISVGFYVIEEGRAKVTMNGEDVGQLGPGDHFGEIALIAETPRAATVTAETDLRCHGMTSWDFRSLVERNGEIAWEMLSSIARKLYENAERERERDRAAAGGTESPV
jgi:CRP/FNR family cyclic AMP-dependent transcriptional regulator